jgi:hypothetical protein
VLHQHQHLLLLLAAFVTPAQVSQWCVAAHPAVAAACAAANAANSAAAAAASVCCYIVAVTH